MKRILITGGPTNEPIDEVMKITNMSTGSLSLALAKLFYDDGWTVTLVLNQGVSAKDLPRDDRMHLVLVETTEEMMDAIEEESKTAQYDGVIHAAAVGDYKADFSFLMEDMAQEIFDRMETCKSAEDILELMRDPSCKLNDDSKISSYQENLTVKLTLTPKIIARLREWFPRTLIFGCKLLENVPQQELFDVAQKLAQKNDVDIILANDLAQLRKGDPARYPVSKEGYVGIKLDTPADIFKFVSEKIS